MIARIAAAAAVLAGVALVPPTKAEEPLNIYSHRQPFLIEPFLERFTDETGVPVNVVYASKGLVQRLEAEGENSPADVVLTVDIARLAVYAEKGLLAPVESAVLAANVPAHLRDPQNRWFGFSKRVRAIVASKERVRTGEIRRVEDLADAKWAGKICTRPGSHVYNRALMASMIAAHGEAAAQDWAAGLVANLARRPQGNDRAQVKAIHEGICDLAIINHYYIGKLKDSEIPEQRDWAASVNLIFPNQGDRGAHVNISGGGIALYSRNKETSLRFLEFLSGVEAQALYGASNLEYPVNPAVGIPPSLDTFGTFKEDSLPIWRIAELAPLAQKIIDRTGW